MPRLITLEGVDISMYFRDHAPLHVHAFHGDESLTRWDAYGGG